MAILPIQPERHTGQFVEWHFSRHCAPLGMTHILPDSVAKWRLATLSGEKLWASLVRGISSVGNVDRRAVDARLSGRSDNKSPLCCSGRTWTETGG